MTGWFKSFEGSGIMFRVNIVSIIITSFITIERHGSYYSEVDRQRHLAQTETRGEFPQSSESSWNQRVRSISRQNTPGLVGDKAGEKPGAQCKQSLVLISAPSEPCQHRKTQHNTTPHNATQCNTTHNRPLPPDTLTTSAWLTGIDFYHPDCTAQTSDTLQ